MRKFLKKLVKSGGGYADTGVGDLEEDFSTRTVGGDFERHRSLLGKLDGVGEKVQKDLSESSRVALQEGG